MVDDSFGFHALFSSVQDPAGVYAAMDSAASGVGLSVVEADTGAWPRRKYAQTGLEPLQVGFQLRPASCHWSLYPVGRRAFEDYGATRIEHLIKAACQAVGVELGRSFREGGIALVQERELGGDVDCLDWCQYFGPAITTKFGLDRLLSAPFARVEALESGGCFAVMGESPFSKPLSMRGVAQHLGMQLRPVYTKDREGKLIEIPWP